MCQSGWLLGEHEALRVCHLHGLHLVTGRRNQDCIFSRGAAGGWFLGDLRGERVLNKVVNMSFSFSHCTSSTSPMVGHCRIICCLFVFFRMDRSIIVFRTAIHVAFASPSSSSSCSRSLRSLLSRSRGGWWGPSPRYTSLEAAQDLAERQVPSEIQAKRLAWLGMVCARRRVARGDLEHRERCYW